MKLNKILSFILLAGILTLAMACSEPGDEASATSTAEPQTPTATPESAAPVGDDAFYALGYAISRNLSDFHLTQEEFDQVERGLEDGVMGREPKVDLEASAQRIQELARERSQLAAGKERAEGQKYLDEAAAAEGAEKTESGLIIQTLKEGSGPSPDPSDTVSVHYHGTLRDGTVFDSSIDRGEPVQFSLDRVVPCWSEGLQKMKVGGKAKLICPPDLAYGDRANGPIPAGSTLTFEVELLGIAGEE